eukprot:11182036-Lingulodinium_polyedra.AAC.1
MATAKAKGHRVVSGFGLVWAGLAANAHGKGHCFVSACGLVWGSSIVVLCVAQWPCQSVGLKALCILPLFA